MTKLEYNGMFFDSSLEINFYKFCETNNIKVEYHPTVIKFKDKCKHEHSYFVDFKVNDSIFVETKGKHLVDENGNLKLIFKKNLSDEEIKYREMVLACKQKCMKDNNVVLLTNENQFDTILNMVNEYNTENKGG